MNDLTRRKVAKDENEEVKKKGKPSEILKTAKGGKSKFYYLTALIFTVCLGGYFRLFQWSSSYTHSATLLDSLSLSLGLKNYIHSIVIDAGSTGSRILHYGFVSSPEGKSLKLYEEFFREIKPGISAFAKNPREIKKTLDSLLAEVRGRIPKEERPKTSLVMKATAGLRLLPDHQADALLNEAKIYLKKSEFRIDKDSVSIMDGSDEGLLSWFTVNFLLDRFGDDVTKSVAALDLGGGSTQVSFVPLENDTLTSFQSRYLTKIRAFHKNLEVFSRSYLGLGLNEGRKRIFEQESNHSLIFKSKCINPLVKTKWTYGGIEYSIRGSDAPRYSRTEVKGEKFVTPIVDFDECEQIVKSALSRFDKSPSLNGKEIYAFSYYYDRAADGGLIDFRKGGTVTISDFVSAAKSKCKEANVDQPFMCLDLVFISVLLRDTFGISTSTEINLVKWLNGHEVSWALGAAFLTLQNQVL